MNGDFTRFTFDPDKLYVQTLMQQGRVQLDADWNEQQALTRHQHETAAAATIGRAGVPKSGGGFQIALAGGGGDLTISPGQLFLDGLLLENRAQAPVALSDQPFLKKQSGGFAGFTLPAATGRYVVYLEAWERHVTTLQDPELLEPALGGADTATRAQLVWQVKLSRDPVAAAATPGQFESWVPPQEVVDGTMSAQTDPSAATPNPCVLPPSAGYRGLENQLYRVEVHQGGPRATATFKWSAYNGSVTTTVGVSGQVLTARDLGRDEVVGFSQGQWIEILDERSELANRRGVLLFIKRVDAEQKELTIDTATPVPALDTSRPIVIRRWDNPAAAPATGIPMTGAPANLEAGVQVSFSAGTFREGDYWLIPARTAINSAGGHIQWPMVGGVSASLPPDGVLRHFTALALVDFNSAAGVFALVGDARLPFPPLTKLTAADVSFNSTVCAFPAARTVQDALDQICRSITGGGCTIVIGPSSDVQGEINKLGAGQSALFCFKPGEITLPKTVLIKGKGDVVFSGAGPATSVSAPDSECVFQFQQCASVQVRNLSVRAGRSSPGPGANAHLSGTLTFLDCPSVSVDNVAMRCASGTEKAAACIAVRNAAAEGDALRAARTPTAITAASEVERVAAQAARTSTARIRNCDLTTGDLQVGILLSNVGVSQVSDNILRVIPPGRPFADRLTDLAFRARVRRVLVSHMKVSPTAGFITGLNAQINIAGHFINFKTPPSLVALNPAANRWNILLPLIPFHQSAKPQHFRVHLKRMAEQVMGFRRTIPAANFTTFASTLAAIEQFELPAATQGIVVTGRMADVVRITDNTLEGVLEGVHVALGHTTATGTQKDQAGEVFINGNTITVSLGSTALRARCAIFVTDSRSMSVSQNYIDVTRAPGVTTPLEGIHIFGNIGRRMIVRENHIKGCPTGIVASPAIITADNTRHNLWIVSDNIMEAASATVVLSKQIRDAEVATKTTIVRRPDNYA